MEVSEKLINESVAAPAESRTGSASTSSTSRVYEFLQVADRRVEELPAPHRRSSTPRSEVATEHRSGVERAKNKKKFSLSVKSEI